MFGMFGKMFEKNTNKFRKIKVYQLTESTIVPCVNRSTTIPCVNVKMPGIDKVEGDFFKLHGKYGDFFDEDDFFVELDRTQDFILPENIFKIMFLLTTK